VSIIFALPVKHVPQGLVYLAQFVPELLVDTCHVYFFLEGNDVGVAFTFLI